MEAVKELTEHKQTTREIHVTIASDVEKLIRLLGTREPMPAVSFRSSSALGRRALTFVRFALMALMGVAFLITCMTLSAIIRMEPN
jgi:hypothetical protein